MKTTKKKTISKPAGNGKRPPAEDPTAAEGGIQYYALSAPLLQATLATLQTELPMVKVRELVQALEQLPAVKLRTEKV